MKLRSILATAAVVATFGLPLPALAGYALSVVPNPAVGTVGGQVVVDINLALDAGDTLLGLDFTLDFDPAVLAYVSAQEGGLTTGWALVPFFDDGAGGIHASLLDPALLGLDSGLGAITGTVAKVTFDLIAQGSSVLGLSGISIVDANFDLQPPTSVSPGTIQVEPRNSVPAPATLPLLAWGLFLLRRRTGSTARSRRSTVRAL